MSTKPKDADREVDGKSERGRRSPSVPLGDAVGYLQAVHKELGTGAASREVVAQALGYKSINGAVTTKIGALTHYDLLERDGATYRVSGVGKALLYPKGDAERRAALAAAAKAPGLYADVVRDRGGQPLPGMLANILIHDYGVHPEKAPEVVEVFRATMEYAGLLRQGVLHESPDGGAAEVAPEPPPAAPEPAPAPAPAAEKEALTSYRVPLPRRRSAVLRLPAPLEPGDVQRLKQWLDLMGETLAE